MERSVLREPVADRELQTKAHTQHLDVRRDTRLDSAIAHNTARFAR